MEKKRLISAGLFYAAAFFGSGAFLYLRLEYTEVYKAAFLSDLVNGTARLPYQYRMLVPSLVGVLEHLPVERVVQFVFKYLSPFSAADLTTHFNGSEIQVFWVLAIELISAFWLIIVYRRLLDVLFGCFPRNALFAFLILYSLAFQAVLSPEPRFYYPSDIPGILFFTLGLLYLIEGRLKAFYVLFVFASLNRETTIFLTFIYIFLNKETDRRSGLHAAFQLFLWGAIKYLVFLYYRDNPGLGVHHGH